MSFLPAARNPVSIASTRADAPKPPARILQLPARPMEIETIEITVVDLDAEESSRPKLFAPLALIMLGAISIAVGLLPVPFLSYSGAVGVVLMASGILLAVTAKTR